MCMNIVILVPNMLCIDYDIISCIAKGDEAEANIII